MRGRPRTRPPRTVPPGQLRRTLEAIRRLRTTFVFGTLMILFLVLLGRLAKLQLFDGDHYRELARTRHQGRVSFQAERGRILDRFGRVLAQSRPLRRVAVDPHPSVVRHPAEFSLLVSRLLDGEISASKIRYLVEREQAKHAADQKIRRYIVIKNNIEDPLLINRLDTVRSMSDRQKRKRNLWGLIVERGEVREYPNDRHAYHVLGKIPHDEKLARVGIEGHFDKHLSGENQRIAVLRDGRRRVMKVQGDLSREGHKGGDVRVTLDVVVQHALEEALDNVVHDWQPSQLCGVVMDPHTGEILAWANRPNRNGNLDDGTPGYQGEHNFLCSWAYEVGSVFKPFTVAWALDQGVVLASDEFDMPIRRSFPGAGKPINDTHHVGWGDVTLLLEQSSNTGAAELARRLGAKGMQAMWKHLQLTSKPEIEFPNVNSGSISREVRHRKTWPGWLYHRAAYGQGNTLTPLQLACLYCALARDDARVVKPSILYRSKPRDPRGPRLCDPKYLPVIRDGLRRVVTQGTARKQVASSEYPIAGKTGTAQFANTHNICTFAGYAPAHDPQFVCLVLARVEKSANGSGASVSGPAVHDVLDATLRYIRYDGSPRAELSSPPPSVPTINPSREGEPGILLAPDPAATGGAR